MALFRRSAASTELPPPSFESEPDEEPELTTPEPLPVPTAEDLAGKTTSQIAEMFQAVADRQQEILLNAGRVALKHGFDGRRCADVRAALTEAGIPMPADGRITATLTVTMPIEFDLDEAEPVTEAQFLEELEVGAYLFRRALEFRGYTSNTTLDSDNTPYSVTDFRQNL